MRSFGFLSVLVAAGLGLFAYQRSLSTGPVAMAPPQQQIDVVGIKSALLSMGESERQYLVAHGAYATLDQLSEAGLLVGGANRRGYGFAAEPDGARGFTITAAPIDDDKKAWPTLQINDTMQVTER
jgi:hypothetical protein